MTWPRLLGAAFAQDRWVNSAPLDLAQLDGKVVLFDVWEYTCINWIRTKPYVKAWHRDYADLGLVVIGVHAPEFTFGRLADNIDRAVRDHGLTYPVAIDNDYAIWEALDNNAWPAKFLFGSRRENTDRWIGEGDYDQTEADIRRLLTEATPGLQLPPVSAEVAAFANVGNPDYSRISPETYIGGDRGHPGTVQFGGVWKSAPQYVELDSDAGDITLAFSGGEVNLVVEPGPTGASTLGVTLDGAPAGPAAGADVDSDSVARFDRSGMLALISGAEQGRHVLTLSARPGLRAYVFTFGP